MTTTATCKRSTPNEGFVSSLAASSDADAAASAASIAATDAGSSVAATVAEEEEASFLAAVKSAIENKEGEYQAPSALNPFGNLLESDALLHPDRRPAPPLNTPQAREDVYSAMVAQVWALHPKEAARMFASSADQFKFRQSLRPFFTGASTTLIPDSGAAWKYMVPNTAAWRDGACRYGSKFRPRFKTGAPQNPTRTGTMSNFRNTADTLVPE